MRPLFFVRQREIARAAEVLAALFPEGKAEAPVVGQAVLMDLAWLCSYLLVLTERERKILERATEGPYEEFLEERRRWPSPEEELAACAVELEWLAGAFGEVGEEVVADRCGEVARALFKAVQEISWVVEVAERFERHRQGEPVGGSKEKGPAFYG